MEANDGAKYGSLVGEIPRGAPMAGNDAEFIAVVNDTDPSVAHADKNGKARTGGKAYALKIT